MKVLPSVKQSVKNSNGTTMPGFFSPILRLQEQQNFRNLEFRREILEFSKKSFHFDGGNLEFPLSLEDFLSLDCVEFSKNR